MWNSLSGLFNWGGNKVFAPAMNVPANFDGVQIGNTGYFIENGMATNLAGDTKPLSDFNGQSVIGVDGKTATLNSGGNAWQQGLGYGLAGLQALSGLMNAYTGYKNYKLAKEQFGFEKAAMNRNIANQAKVINNAYDNAAQVAAGMIGARDSAGNYGMTSQDVVDRYAANAEKKHVDGSRIG